MQTFLRKNERDKSENLILFFCGWAMDETPFSSLKSDSDVLFVYDYSDLSFEYDFSMYKKITLLAFSYGVYAAGCAKLPQTSTKVAVNGTLVPVHDEYGVPVKKFALSEKMNSETISKFRARLFGGESAEKHLEMFERNLPNRTAESCTKELTGMKKVFKTTPLPELEFDKVYISKGDIVVPTKNQKNFWKKVSASNIIELESGHFPFYNYEKFEELI